MKVVISVEPVRYPLTGIGRYAYELSSRLKDVRNVDIKLFSGWKFLEDVPEPTENIVNQYRIKKIIQRSGLAMELYRKISPVLKRFALKDSDNYLYHGTNFYLPPFAGYSIATFHDISPFIHANFHPKSRNDMMKKEIELSLKRASRLIAVSENAKKEISSYFSWPEEQVDVTTLACSSQYYPREKSDIGSTLAKYGLEYQSYLLCVGTIEPRKNVDGLILAYGRLDQKIRKKYPLVLIGYRGWNNENIFSLIEKGTREGWVKYIGFVQDFDLPYIYSGAKLFVFPSHYEGFGLPALEAISSGVPIVSSNSSSIPEVVGDCAMMCNPNDIEELSILINIGIEDDSWRAGAIKKGLAQSIKFSWEKCAIETLASYGKVIA